MSRNSPFKCGFQKNKYILFLVLERYRKQILVWPFWLPHCCDGPFIGLNGAIVLEPVAVPEFLKCATVRSGKNFQRLRNIWVFEHENAQFITVLPFLNIFFLGALGYFACTTILVAHKNTFRKSAQFLFWFNSFKGFILENRLVSPIL